jgi:hypothetical protein
VLLFQWGEGDFDDLNIICDEVFWGLDS